MSSIAVAIVNHNVRELLRSCLASVTADNPASIVVVDNASSDGSADMVRAEYPQVTLHINPRNRGYGAAANQAFKLCVAPYVLLLNSDTLVYRGALEALVNYLDGHPRAAVLGPRVVNMDGTLQRSTFHFPSPLHSLLMASQLGRVPSYVPWLRERYLPSWAHNESRVVPWLLGAALAIRRRAFDAIGGFDESFFMYSEEVDLCYRFRAAGWEVHWSPASTIAHIGGASTSQRRADMEVRKYTTTKQFYQRHYSRHQLTQLRLIVIYSMFRNIVRDLVRLLFARGTEERGTIATDLNIWKGVLVTFTHGR